VPFTSTQWPQKKTFQKQTLRGLPKKIDKKAVLHTLKLTE